MLDSDDEKRRFILENTTIGVPPHVPEIKLHLADEAHELWLKTEEELEAIGLPPPFWAFAWAGGQGLARYILDDPLFLYGNRALDFASGSGLVAIAAKMSGAEGVVANDIDPFSRVSVKMNAKLNGVDVDFLHHNLLDGKVRTVKDFDCILAGDVFYDKNMAQKVFPFLRDQAAGGKHVLVGDPGRSYLPTEHLFKLAEYEVPVTRALEDSEVKKTCVWMVSG